MAPRVIVSNNAEAAIRAYFERWSLTPYVFDMIGRPRPRPDLMKPNIHTVDEVLRLLSAKPRQAVFIGDSVSDVEVSRAAGAAALSCALLVRTRSIYRIFSRRNASPAIHPLLSRTPAHDQE